MNLTDRRRAISDEDCQRAAEALRNNNGNQAAAAREIGEARSTLQDWVKRAARKGMLGFQPVMPGYVVSTVSTQTGAGGEKEREWITQRPEPIDAQAVPTGHSVKGVSSLVNATGEVQARWIKTKADEPSLESVIETLKSAFSDIEGAAKPAKQPDTVAADLLTLVPCNDWHLNLLTWAREVGQNWNLKDAERTIGAAIEDAISRSPSSEIGVVLGGGDLVHADGKLNQTTSGTPQNVDDRYQKGLEAVFRLKVKTIDAALQKNKTVIVRILPGNHDEITSVAIVYYLLAWYRNEPRVTVDVDASLFFYFRFGKVMLAATHGHTVKLKDMPSIMAHRRAEDWGATRFRYGHGFHLHHKSQLVSEGGGVSLETHQAPIPQDAWHHASGFLSGRSIQTISYHKEFGEVSRVRVAILDAN